jgi:hypothetical protein
MKLILQIALGVTLGIMLSGILGMAFWGTVLLKLVQPLTPPQLVQPLTQPMQNSTAQQPTITMTDAEKIIAQLGTQPPVQTQPVETVKTPTAADIQAQQLATQEEQKKKDAFKNWYHKSEQCLSQYNSHDTLVACGNEYIRAKAKFEELWQQGKFKN